VVGCRGYNSEQETWRRDRAVGSSEGREQSSACWCRRMSWTQHRHDKGRWALVLEGEEREGKAGRRSGVGGYREEARDGMFWWQSERDSGQVGFFLYFSVLAENGYEGI